MSRDMSERSKAIVHFQSLVLGLSSGAVALITSQVSKLADLQWTTRVVLAISLIGMLACILLSLGAIAHYNALANEPNDDKIGKRAASLSYWSGVAFGGGFMFGGLEILRILLFN